VSGGELVLLLLVVLLALGARRLPDAGRLVGKGLRTLHRARNEMRTSIDDATERPHPAARATRLID
jgi:Sec-independent protein translocase protein TatA